MDKQEVKQKCLNQKIAYVEYEIYNGNNFNNGNDFKYLRLVLENGTIITCTESIDDEGEIQII